MTLIHFHRLNNAGGSEVGVDPTEEGTASFAAGKFDNGIDQPTASNGLKWTDIMTAEQVNAPFTVERWWKPSFSSSDSNANRMLFSLVNGNEQIGVLYNWAGVGGVGQITVHAVNYNTGYGAIYNFFPPAWQIVEDYNSLPAPEIAGKFFLVETSITGHSRGLYRDTGTAIEFLNEKPFLDVGVVFDQSQGAGNKLKLFIHNEEVVTHDVFYYGGDTAWEFESPTELKFASVAFDVYTEALFDNSKIYDDAKTDFSDMNDEDAGFSEPPDDESQFVN